MLDSQLFFLGGSPDDIRYSAGQWATFSDSNLTAADQISRMDLADFRGDEAELHREKLHREFTPALQATGLAWSRTAAALSTYAGVLESCQQQLQRLSTQAHDQQAAATAAELNATAAIAADTRHATEIGATAVFQPAGAPSPPDPYRSGVADAATRVTAAHASLTATLAAAAAIRQQHTDAVERCAAAIDEAAAGSPARCYLTGAVTQGAQDSHGYGRQDPLFAASSVLRQVSNASGLFGVQLPAAAGQLLPLLASTVWARMSNAIIQAQTIGLAAPAGAAHAGVPQAGVPTSPWLLGNGSAKNASFKNGGVPGATFKNNPTQSAGPKPWVDNAGRHNAARDAAYAQIRKQVIANGGNPAGLAVETRVEAGAKNGSGNDGRADITYVDPKTQTIYVWEVKGSTNPIGAFAQGLTAVGEVQFYIAALTKRGGYKHYAAGFPMTAPVTTSYTAKDGSTEALTVVQGPGPGAIVYTSDKTPKGPVRVPVPFPVPVPVPVPNAKPVPVPAAPPSLNPAPVIGGLAAGGLLWWLGKLASPLCGPGAPVCAVVL